MIFISRVISKNIHKNTLCTSKISLPKNVTPRFDSLIPLSATLLQNATAILLQNEVKLITECDSFVTKCDDFIVKCDSYCK